MARDENPPFGLGETYFGGDTTVIDATVAVHLEGQEYEFEVPNGVSTIGSNGTRGGRRLKARIVRNKNATTANAKEVHKLKLDGTNAEDKIGQIDGKTAAYTDKGVPIDPFLGSAGCLQNDMCWAIVDGISTVTTDTGGDTNFAVGALIAPGATTAGRVIEGDATVTGANLFLLMRNAIGLALEAKNGTSLDVLVDVGGHHRL